MSRQITQETYDAVVQENIEEFSMSPEEAIADAIKQFECQDVDLTNIIKDLSIGNKQILNDSIEKLTNSTSTEKEIIDALNILQAECDKDIAHRVLAGSKSSYDIILELMTSREKKPKIIFACLKSMISLMSGQPDLLTNPGIDLMMRFLETQTNLEIQCLLLKWIKECCLKHEMNRQRIFNADILEHLKVMLNHDNALVLIEICGVLRALVLDDDVRVEFGKAHDHARTIATHTLSPMIKLLKKYKKNEDLVNELLLTLSALIVRNEFCKDVEDAGGLDFALTSLKDFIHNQKITRTVFKLIKVLAGNDDCKAHFIQKGGAGVIVAAISEFETNCQTAHLGMNCIAALTLRSPENSKALFEAGLPSVIASVMNNHRNFMPVQKSASWAIRNMVVRCQYQIKTFLELGVEEILKENLGKFKDCEYDIKSALRDLHCYVELKEEWTGKGGKITTQQNIDLDYED